jgi:protein-tyrosine phosphatase
MDDRLIPLSGPANFRDVGGYETVHGRHVRTGRVYRADSLSYMTDEDVRHVLDVLELRTVVDLRGIGEVEKFTHGPLGSLGVTVAHIPIVDETRRPPEGWDNEVPVAMDALYLLMLERFGHRFAEVLRLLSDEDAQPVVFHCAAGKDRTGLVAMLVLGLLGVDPDVIAADYALTDARMPVLLERHQARGVEGGLVEVAEQHYAVDEAAMRAVIARLDEQHGSIEGYVLAQGLEREAVASLRSSLLS